MSKIGILTYHRAYNYGALLQAFALNMVLRKEGHEVYFIDYWPEYHKKMYALFSFSKLKGKTFKSKIFYIWNSFVHFFARKKLYDRIQKNVESLILPYTSSDATYDVIVYGSDQIWRKQPILNEYNPVYFGKNVFFAKKHVAYAASMGKLPQNERDRRTICSLVKNFDEISVREADLHELLKELGVGSKLVLDPTLLLSVDDWNALVPASNGFDSDYVLFFEIVRNSFNLEQVKSFASSKRMNMKILYNDIRKIDSEIPTTNADVFGFLDCVKNAKFVFTSSFHALVFSILFHKQFFACFRSNEGRAKTLLCSLGLENRLLKYGEPIPKDYGFINYDAVEEKLIVLRSQSKDVLKKMVNLNEN